MNELPHPKLISLLEISLLPQSKKEKIEAEKISTEHFGHLLQQKCEASERIAIKLKRATKTLHLKLQESVIEQKLLEDNVRLLQTTSSLGEEVTGLPLF